MIDFFFSSFMLPNFPSEPSEAIFPSYFFFFLPLNVSYLALYFKPFLHSLQFSILFCLSAPPCYLISWILRSFSCFQPIFLPHSEKCFFSSLHRLSWELTSQFPPHRSPPPFCLFPPLLSLSLVIFSAIFKKRLKQLAKMFSIEWIKERNLRARHEESWDRKCDVNEKWGQYTTSAVVEFPGDSLLFPLAFLWWSFSLEARQRRLPGAQGSKGTVIT